MAQYDVSSAVVANSWTLTNGCFGIGINSCANGENSSAIVPNISAINLNSSAISVCKENGEIRCHIWGVGSGENALSSEEIEVV